MKYAIELQSEDLVIEVPEGCTVEISGRHDSPTKDIHIKQVVGREGEGDYAYNVTSIIAYYTNVEAVRCLDLVKRQQDDVA